VDWFEKHSELREPRRTTSAYRVSKQAVNAWSTLTAASRGELGIRQNAIMPGFTESPMGAEFRDVLGAGYFDEYPTPLGHYLRPDEPAKVLLFLNSELASGVNGVSLLVDGGADAALQAKAPLTSA
jgi:NAD(P)-dependent dehydrogenase (short-subunit alcohol dehydrogenase family)